MLIKNVKLLTAQLEELENFYSNTLGLSVIEQSNNYFTVQIGCSILTFEATENSEEYPFYHFAIDISNNKLQESVKWLEEKGVNLNELSGSSYHVYSETWNATSIYFYDPAGNILELIARHSLKNATKGQFQSSDLIRISEIGLVVPDVPSTRELLNSKFSLTEYKDYYDRFSAMGDEIGLFILSAHKRVWLGSDKPAEIYKTEVTIESDVEKEHYFSGLPYIIRSKQLDRLHLVRQ